MTSPALFVLSLALVCSTCGIASEQEADHDINTKMRMSKFDLDFNNRWTNKLNRKFITPDYEDHIEVATPKFKSIDEIYKDNELQVANFNIHRINVRRLQGHVRNFDDTRLKVNHRMKREDHDPRCDNFKLDNNEIMHPHDKQSLKKYYYNNSNCVTVINATQDTDVITLTFVDMFRIEHHPQCAYDYLEIRNGLHGYAEELKKVCGSTFPNQITTTGPNVWLKFRSDDTIEYEGFKIHVDFHNGNSHKIPESCYHVLESNYGFVENKSIGAECLAGTNNQALDVLWTIKTKPNTKIYLNFTEYDLAKPNECEENVIQVFGSVLELDSKLAQFCGSVANSVTTKDGADSNIMYIRLFIAKKENREKLKFKATYNSFRVLDTTKEGAGCNSDEFDCEDNTCIDWALRCDTYAQCRLKADEDPAKCDVKAESTLGQTHIKVILVIFSLILSGMTFVFLFKCIRKLYQDHKLIKEHLQQSCEDRLDSMHGSRCTLDPKQLERDSHPRASLERENHTNEMVKRQRSNSKHKQSSIESDYIQETRLDLDEEPWRRDVDSMPIEAEDIRIERNGRTRRSDLSKKEESIRSRTKDSDGSRGKKEIRDVSVGAPDTKESGCQTRESLFQTDPPPSSDDSPIYCTDRAGFKTAQPRPTTMRLNSSKDELFSLLSFPGSGTNSRGFSTFGYSGATIARPPTPTATNTSEIHIELLKQPSQEPKQQKKVDRRPISTETTRSAPDVIIVSKPIR